MSLSTSQVIEAAVRLVDENGALGLGFNRLARELGVKPPSLYNHVKDASDLQRLVAISGWSIYATQAELALGRKRGGNALRALGHAYLTLARSRPGLFAIMSSTPLSPTDADHAPTSTKLISLFQTPLQELGVPQRHVWNALRTVRASLHGFVWLQQQGMFVAEENVDKSFEYMLDVLVRGLCL